jgi:hypothetical protein
MHRKLLLLFIPLVMLLAPAAALADSDHVPIGQTALGLSLWALGVGALVPLATYVLNRFVPNEPARAAVLLIVAAIAGALTQLINAGSIGFDTATLRYVLSAVIAARAARSGVGSSVRWRPAQATGRLLAGGRQVDARLFRLWRPDLTEGSTLQSLLESCVASRRRGSITCGTALGARRQERRLLAVDWTRNPQGPWSDQSGGSRRRNRSSSRRRLGADLRPRAPGA